MEIIPTPLHDCVLIKTRKFGDERGYFMESFHQNKLADLGIMIEVKQVNMVKSQANVLRGLHFQNGEFAQAKLVGVISGAVLDVVVDIRPGSKTYHQSFTKILEDPAELLYVPRGFAHGYKSIVDDTIFFYAVDNYYSPENEGGIRYNDPNLRIDWDLNQEPIISEKDLNQPFLKQNITK